MRGSLSHTLEKSRAHDAVPRNDALDGLRGYAAITVLVVHSILAFDALNADRVLARPIQHMDSLYKFAMKIVFTIFNGQAAVAFFFILSGCVLFQSLLRASSGGKRAIALTFSLRRILRIYPALVLCLAAFWALNHFMAGFESLNLAPVGTDKLLSNALLTEIGMHGATWTLQVEMLAVPFILGSFVLARRFGYPGLFLALFCSLAVFFNPAVLLGLPYIGRCAFYFALGFFITTDQGRELFKRAPGWLWMVSLLGVIGPRAFMFQTSTPGIFLEGFFAFLIVGQLFHQRSGALFRFLTLPFSRLMGRTSYSFYLYNVPILNGFMWLVMANVPRFDLHPLEIGLVVAVLTTLLTIPIAYLSYRYIELPFIELGRRIGRPGAPAAVETTGRPIPTTAPPLTAAGVSESYQTVT